MGVAGGRVAKFLDSACTTLLTSHENCKLTTNCFPCCDNLCGEPKHVINKKCSHCNFQVEGRYRLEVNVLSYSNPGNRDWRGNCCDVGCGTCDILFFFCLRAFGFTPPNSDSCSLGVRITTNPISTSSRTFGGTVDGRLGNPVTFTSSNAWPVRYLYL